MKRITAVCAILAVLGACGARTDLGPWIAPLDLPCPDGFADCDGDPTTICETEIANDDGNCGACGVRCPSGLVCGGGRCVPPTYFVEVSSTSFFSCARRASGAVLCWGADEFNELASPPTDAFENIPYRATPEEVPGIDDALEIATQDRTACARRRSKRVQCWGDTTASNINGTTSSGVIDMPISGPIAKLAIGSYGACVLRPDGSVWCWGANECGQLGRGTATPGVFADPAPVVATTRFHSLVGGGDQSACASSVAGRVFCWGTDFSGELAGATTATTGAVDCPFLPIQPTPSDAALDHITAISGDVTRCGLRDSGDVICWGDNGFGPFSSFYDAGVTLENGGDAVRPYVIPGIDDVAQVSASQTSMCARLKSGAITCWGDSGYDASLDWSVCGLLGDAEIDDAVDLSVGGTEACVARTDGSIWCWGDNRVGELGPNGPQTCTGAPVRVVGP